MRGCSASDATSRRLKPGLACWRAINLFLRLLAGAQPGISAPAGIVEDASSMAHGVLYRLPLRKFARLDSSEGKQYRYLWTDVEDQAGNHLPSVTYRVSSSLGAEGKLGKKYMALIRDAARERRLPQSHIDFREGIEVRG